MTEEHRRDLAGCYSSCLNLLKDHQLRSIAFCCISTGRSVAVMITRKGIFGFPQKEAARVATSTVKDWLKVPSNKDAVDVVLFNVFTPTDEEIYKEILGSDLSAK